MRRSLSLLERVDYRLAQTAAEKDEIYHLRYRAYSREGMVKESAERRVTDQFDDLPNSWTFGVYLFGELFSSVRISVLNAEWRKSTSAHVFGEILHAEARSRRGHRRSRRASSPIPTRPERFPELPYLTLRLAYMACEYFKADLGLAIVRPEHQAFYRRVFLHETIAEPRLVPGLAKPVGLMAADFPALHEKVFERYPIMRSTAFETAHAVRASDRPAACLRVRGGARADHGPPHLTVGIPGRIGLRRCCRKATPSDSLVKSAQNRPKRDMARCGLPSPSRHIYNSLTIAVAFRRFAAFEGILATPHQG